MIVTEVAHKIALACMNKFLELAEMSLENADLPEYERGVAAFTEVAATVLQKAIEAEPDGRPYGD